MGLKLTMQSVLNQMIAQVQALLDMQESPDDLQLVHDCHPSMKDVAFSYQETGPALACGQAEAVALRKALDEAGYNEEALRRDLGAVGSTKDQFAYLFSASDTGELSLPSFMSDIRSKSGDTKLGTLERFFAVGLPVNKSEVKAALGEKATVALQKCNLVVECAKNPLAWTSALTLLPVPHTSVIIATDWYERFSGANEELVNFMGADRLGLVPITPSSANLRVVDVGAGSGVQGLVAAARGAAHVTMTDANPRAVRFARFNAWMNRVDDKVDVVQGDVRDPLIALKPRYDVMLANTPFVLAPLGRENGLHANSGSSRMAALDKVIDLAKTLLGPHGRFVIATTLPNPDDFREHLRSKLWEAGFSSSVVHAPVKPLETYAIERSVANAKTGRDLPQHFQKEIKNLKAHHITSVAEGFVFGQRAAKVTAVKSSSTADRWDNARLGEVEKHSSRSRASASSGKILAAVLPATAACWIEARVSSPRAKCAARVRVREFL